MNDLAIIDCQDVSRSYQQGQTRIPVLKTINLQLYAGQRIAIIGASGAGKSTLLHLLGGLERPDSGCIKINGQALDCLPDKQRCQIRNRTLGFVYQFHHLLPEFSALENVSIPLRIARQSPDRAYEKSRQILSRVGLEYRLHHKPAELSGGERQRVAIARALVTQPAGILADEPTGNLDDQQAKQIYHLLVELNTELNTGLLLATHDQQLIRQIPTVLHLRSGQLQSD